MNTLSRLALVFVPLAFTACASTDASDAGGDTTDSASGTYYECDGLGTSNQVFLDIKKSSITVTVEDVGTNTATLTTAADGSKTYSKWTTATFFGATDTLVVPDTLTSTGAGTVNWQISGVNSGWQGSCKKQAPAADECLPLVDQIDPIDGDAKPSYTRVSKGNYGVTIPNGTVGDFVYGVATTTTGILCVVGDITPTSCSAIVADAIAQQAFTDGSSSGQPYVSSRKSADGGESWSGGVHDDESGEFAYTVTTDTTADGCKVTGITTVSN